MPFAFTLPTTSILSFSKFLHSDSHPSLIWAATTQRNVVRNVLKTHKRLSLQAQAANLSNVFAALNEYLPYLFALDSGLSGRTVAGEEIDIILAKEIVVEWRPSLAMTISGREPPRIKGSGLDYEIFFALTTLAYTHVVLARVKLNSLYATSSFSADEKPTIISTAIRHLLQANSIHNFLIPRAKESHNPSLAVDVLSSVQSALASLSLAEATLLAVLKDDPYPSVVAQSRNESDREWMIKAPEIPKVRAHLFARLCLAAAEHAGRAHAQLGNPDEGRGKLINKSLVDYTRDLQRTSRAKACRFFGIDAELGGKTGEAISWTAGGKKELGFKMSDQDGAKITGLEKLKKDWAERREDKHVKKGGEWGGDAGRFEEARILEMLEKKWNKANDLVSNRLHSKPGEKALKCPKINTQRIPPSESLVSAMPSGREIHSPKPYTTPSLEADTVARLRAPLDHNEEHRSIESDNSTDEDEGSGSALPGSFPRMTVSDDGTYY